MGLDMYLYAEKYLADWHHANKEKVSDSAKVAREIRGLIGLDGIDGNGGSQSVTVQITVAYWRKSNQIHSWFVNNCQGGVDDCRNSYVSPDQLRELKDICEQILDTAVTHTETLHDESANKPYETTILDSIDTDLIEKLLAPRGGFFFGSTEINAWHVDDLRDTVRMIDSILNNPKLQDVDFYYHSSW